MSQPNENTIVDDHRNMLQVSKNVSVFQEQNLKSWAFIFLDDVDTVKVSWDFFKKNKAVEFCAGKVIFDIKFKKGTVIDPVKAKIGMDQLIASTKFLFWSETKVTIKKSGKLWKIKESSEEVETSAPKK